MRKIEKPSLEGVRLREGTKIGRYCVLGGRANPVTLGKHCHVHDHVVIRSGVRIGDNVEIEEFSCIDKDSQVQDHVIIESHSYIGPNVIIGRGSQVLYGARIYDDSRIGLSTMIGGFVGENCIIGNNSRVFGKLIHSLRDPARWNLRKLTHEKSPEIGDFVVIGVDALVIGGVTVRDHVYVAAGSIVSKDIPSYCVVTGINRIVPFREWHGKIKDSGFWKWGTQMNTVQEVKH
jgi:UDP-3-O-[3-hydroxymyristoyl] glucosamine N-acyltransferase